MKVGTINEHGIITGEREIDPYRCPKLIMLGDHYNPDGSCKCSEASYQAQLAKWGYDVQLPTCGKRVKVTMEDGGRYAPCSYLFRIVREDLHRKAMGHTPADRRSDNVLINEPWALVPKRHHRDLSEGWAVTFLMDLESAMALYVCE